MQLSGSILSELESVVRDGARDKRLDILRQVTDLFLVDNERLSDSQIVLFDDVLTCLVRSVESKARAELSTRLAPIDNAPPQVIQRLARDDEIAVAGPVLAHSARLGEADLVEIAKSKSQAHLLAISGRERLGRTVTDVLVDRGDRNVMGRLVKNTGAAFSDAGFATLSRKAENDQALLESLGRRLDLPLKLFRELLAKATEIVRSRLLASAPPERQAEIRRVLHRVSIDVGRDAGVGRSREDAERSLTFMYERGELHPSILHEFAKVDRFEQVRAAIALLCDVPFGLVDRIVFSQRNDGLLILLKTADVDVKTLLAILRMPSFPHGSSDHDLERARTEYARLSAATAQRVVRFWKVRHTAIPPGATAEFHVPVSLTGA